MSVLISLAAGLIFGLGLVVSGMIDPAKVQNFLDIAGTWDPSLCFVMIGAIAVTASGYAIAWRRRGPILAERYDLPSKTPVDARLLTGAALFGIGWGLAGLCPGPALTSLLLGAPGIFSFLAAMITGFVVSVLLGDKAAGPPAG